MNKFRMLLKPEQYDVLAAWLPDDHEASVARLSSLRAHSRQGQQQLRDREDFARLRALESAASAGLWVLKRLPTALHEKQQLEAAAAAQRTATVGRATASAPGVPSQPNL